MKARLELTQKTKKVLKDNPKFTRKWVDGLLSGNYIQIRDSMCDEFTPHSACCLLVMEIECNDKKWEDAIGLGLPNHLQDNLILDGEFFPERFKADLYIGGNHIPLKQKPPQWNDILLLSFEQIATLLKDGFVEYESDEQGVSIG